MAQAFLKQRSTLVALAAAAFLAACGGGSSSSSTTETGGSTGTCTAAPCVNFTDTTLALSAGFGGMEEAGAFEIVNDPVNASNKVLKLTKKETYEAWAGVTVVSGVSAGGASPSKALGQVFAPAADASTEVIDPSKGITLRVYSAAVGVPVMVKIENASNDQVYAEATALSTKANEWETLTFTYGSASTSATYNKISVFPAFDQKVAAVVHIDELKYSTKTLTPVTGGLTIVNFDETTPAVLDAFEGTSFVATTDGTNKVAQLNKPASAQPWGGATFQSCPAGTVGKTPSIPFTSSNQTITIKVKAPRVGVVFSLEVKDASDPTNLVFAEATSTSTDWETLTFNFANKTFGTAINPSSVYNQMSIFPNFSKANETSAAKETEDRIYLIDDVKLLGSEATLGSCPAVPVSAAPTDAPAAPTASAANVISIYSNAYTQTTGVNLNPNWSQPTVVTEETIAGNAVQKYATFSYQGIDFAENPIDVSAAAGFTALHVDFWSADVTSVDVFLISTSGGAEQAVNVPLTANSWKSIDIPLSSYTTPTRTAINQLKLVATPSGKTVFVDNIYFVKGSAPSGAAKK